MITEYAVRYADGKVFDIYENRAEAENGLRWALDSYAEFLETGDLFLENFEGAHLVTRQFETDHARPANDEGWEPVA